MTLKLINLLKIVVIKLNVGLIIYTIWFSPISIDCSPKDSGLIADIGTYSIEYADSDAEMLSKTRVKREDSPQGEKEFVSKKEQKADNIKDLPEGVDVDDDYDENEQSSLHLNSLDFEDSPKWKYYYHGCNPELNQYTSPVEILTAEVIHVKDTQTLHVFSEPPKPDTYILSTLHKSSQFEVEAFSIRLKNDDVVRDATFIGGLGVLEQRFFDNAVIFMTLAPGNEETKNDGAEYISPLPPSRRFHTIDGRNYPMEIMFTFKTNLDQHVTQIHVLVDIVAEENPAWKPLIDMIPDLENNIVDEKCKGNETVAKMRRKKEEAYRQYKLKLEEQRVKLKGGTYEEYLAELEDLYELVKTANKESIDTLQAEYKVARTKHKKCAKMVKKSQLALEAQQKDLVLLREEKQKEAMLLKQLVDEKEAKAKEESGKSKKAEEEKNKQANTAQLQDPVEAAQDRVTTLTYALEEKLAEHRKTQSESSNNALCVKEQEAIVNRTEVEVHKRKKILQDNKIGTREHDLFPSVEDLNETRVNTKNKKQELDRLLNTYEGEMYNFEDIMSIQQQSAIVLEPFHISWLFPDRGGHYFYNGSNPIPPCERRPHVLVFEDRITISRNQYIDLTSIISARQSIPDWIKICDDNEWAGNREVRNDYIRNTLGKIKNSVPAITPLGDRTIWYNPRNLQYKDDDGMHMESKRRKERKLQGKTTPKSASKP